MATNINWNNTYQNLWDIEVVLWRKFVEITAFIQKKKSQINNLTVHLKKLEKQKQIKPKFNRRREITKIRAEISEKETRKPIKNWWNKELMFWKDKQNS